MPAEKLVITIFANDRPGIVQALSDTVFSYKGNWLESSLSRLCGQFTGIVHISIDEGKKSALVTALNDLASDGIQVTLQDSNGFGVDDDEIESIQILIEANDRPGIVEEIASALSDVNVNVEHMDTECESASMAGYDLFRAHLSLALPDGFGEMELEQALENVSDDLTVSVLQD